jgi:hypothetical protein
MTVKVASRPKLDEKVVEIVMRVLVGAPALSEGRKDPATMVMR